MKSTKRNAVCANAADWLAEEGKSKSGLARACASGVGLAAYPCPGGFNPYSIEWERLNEPVKVVRWIRHLTGKTWFTADMCRDLIDVVSEHWGWQGGAL